MDNVKIVENGVESEVASLAYIKLNGKNYLFYSLNDFTENGLPKIRIAACNNADNNIYDDEWANIKSLISNNSNKIDVPNTEYMKIENIDYIIGPVKKLAVKPELKQAFCDFVNAKIISNNTQPAPVEGPVNEQMPYYDQTIDTSNKIEQIENQEVGPNAFNNTMQPPVPNAETSPMNIEGEISAPVNANPSQTVEPAPVEPVNAVEPQPVAPAPTPQVLKVEPQPAIVQPVVEQPVIQNIQPSNNADMLNEFKDIILQNLNVIETSIKNIRSALEVTSTQRVLRNEQPSVVTPVVANAPLEGPVLEQQTISPAPILDNTPVMPEPVAPVMPETVEVPVEPVAPAMPEVAPVPVEPVAPVMSETVEVPVAPIATVMPEAVEVPVEPVVLPNEPVEQPVQMPNNVSPGQVASPFPNEVSSVPEINAMPNQVVSDVNSAFVGMSPGTMPVGE